MDELLVVDKPKGPTSYRVVHMIKRRLGVKAGHTGTLDPLATGVLIVLTGRRTKEASRFLHMDKAYRVEGVLGMEMDTFDVNGKVVKQDHSAVTREQLAAALEHFKGKVRQVPPPYSAKRMAGRKAYELARKGLTVEMPAREVDVYALDLVEFDYPHFTLVCEVSSGFYVRSLVHDVGVELGVGAVVAEVRRIRVGSYGIDQAKPLDEILGS